MHAHNFNGFTLSHACRCRPHITADVHGSKLSAG